jgi:hypothetical protein
MGKKDYMSISGKMIKTCVGQRDDLIVSGHWCYSVKHMPSKGAKIMKTGKNILWFGCYF